MLKFVDCRLPGFKLRDIHFLDEMKLFCLLLLNLKKNTEGGFTENEQFLSGCRH
jgi:hypothetical protein